MATYTKIGSKVRVQIRRAGKKSITKTCNTEKEAKAWATRIEGDILAGKKVGALGLTGITVAEGVDRYIKENGDNMSKTGHDMMRYLKEGIGKLHIAKLSDDDIVDYLEEKDFSAASGAMHFSYFCSLLNMASIGWKYHVPDILTVAGKRLKKLGLIGKSRHRDRRPSQLEIDALLSYKFSKDIPMKDIITFAISNAMRISEIMRIEFGTLKLPKEKNERATILITDRKHPTKGKGNHKTVPLLAESLEIIQKQPKREFTDKIFPFEAKEVARRFRNACTALNIDDLRFHDLRHEGTSRLFEMGFQIQQVSLFTGHEDWKNLKRYTQLKPEQVQLFEIPKKEVAAITMGTIEMDAETLKQFKMFQTMMASMKQAETA